MFGTDIPIHLEDIEEKREGDSKKPPPPVRRGFMLQEISREKDKESFHRSRYEAG